MVTGSIVNGNTSPAGWASYFLDHSSALPGRPSGELRGAPAHCSYVREFLEEIGGFPDDVRAGEDTVANQRLWRRGHRAFRESAIRLTHRSPCSTTWALIHHHFLRGRALGRLFRDEATAGRAGRLGLHRYLLRYPRFRLSSTDFRVSEWGDDLRPKYRRVRRLVIVGIGAAWLGTYFELACGPRRSFPIEELGDGHRLEPHQLEVLDDGRDRGDGGRAVLVKDDDRSGSG